MRYQFLRRNFWAFFVSIILSCYFFFSVPIRASSELERNYLPITGSFWLTDFDISHNSKKLVDAILTDMHSANIDTVIITAIGVLKKENGSYKYYDNTKVPGQDTVFRNIFQYAENNHMKVVIGLAGTDNINYIGNASDRATLISFSLQLAKEIQKQSKNWHIDWDNTILGFYITPENEVGEVVNNGTVAAFYQELVQKIKANFPSKKIVWSPYLYQNTDYSLAKRGFQKILAMGIDIIAPQDSVGSGLTKTRERDEDHFKALADAIKSKPEYFSREAWANIETFRMNGSKHQPTYDPARLDRIAWQIEAAFPYVSKFITWIFQHTMMATPAMIKIDGWTKQYSPKRLALRTALRENYENFFDLHRALIVFPWGNNLVLKGFGFSTDSNVTINHNGKAWSGRVWPVEENGNDVVYISLARLRSAGIYDVSDIKPEEVSFSPVALPTVITNPTPTLLPSPTLTPTPPPSPTPSQCLPSDQLVWSIDTWIAEASGGNGNNYDHIKRSDWKTDVNCDGYVNLLDFETIRRRQ